MNTVSEFGMACYDRNVEEAFRMPAGDAMHFRIGSYAQWLYGDMMLYYLKYYTSSTPSHCLTSNATTGSM